VTNKGLLILLIVANSIYEVLITLNGQYISKLHDYNAADKARFFQKQWTYVVPANIFYSNPVLTAIFASFLETAQ